ncbi:ATP-binding protein [Sulfurospirillum sp. 1612]|uniref:ATP-binding protein n=1 Tax=Sulfurospirillum sp. 1612 TaxID=3094835 RepID=UPI002F959106
MKHLSIKIKFIILGTIGFIALSCIVFLALNMGKLGQGSLDNVYTDSRNVQTLQQNYIAPIFQLRELSLSLVVAPNKNFREGIKQKLFPLMKTLDHKFMTLNKETQAQWNHYKTSLEKTLYFINQGFEEGAFINVNQKERERFDILVTSLKKLQAKELSKSQTSYDNAKKTINNYIMLIIIVSLILVLFNLFLGTYIIMRISRSIQEVQEGLGRFFTFLRNRKDVEGVVGITLDTHDELGAMAKAINAEIKKTQVALRADIKLIESATLMVQEIKNGNLYKRLDVSAKTKELNLLRSMINDMIDVLEMRIQQEINRRADQEKLLIQQSKLAAMGNMIGNIAHQWRQPLSELNAILMNIETKYRFNDFDINFIEESVAKCNKITAYMSNTISDFQNFFKPSKQKEKFLVVEACKRASSILKSSLANNNIRFECSFDGEKEVFGYPNEFSQALLNILSNAKDVLIQRKSEDPCIKVTIKSGKQFVLISIQDNGGGIEEKNIDRIFEPYFTTKHAKQGTGIGLYMSKTIIEGNMDGFLVAKNIDGGARFTIKIK